MIKEKKKIKNQFFFTAPILLVALLLLAPAMATLPFVNLAPSLFTEAAAQEPQLHELTIASAADGAPGEATSGMWVSLRTADGVYIGSGYTPITYPGTAGETVVVTVQDYDGVAFRQWEDGSTNSSRTITLPTGSNASQITARYDAGNSIRGPAPLTYEGAGGQPSLTVQAMQGNETLNIWTIIEPQPQAGGNETSATANATTFKVYAGNFRDHVFDRWGDDGDGGNDRVRTLTISENTTITAHYKTAGSSIVIPLGAEDPANPPYEPAELSVEKGETIVVSNVDVAPHSVTSGTGSEDPAAANAFEAGLMFPGDYAHIETDKLDTGEYPYYCFIHPYMKGKLTVAEAGQEPTTPPPGNNGNGTDNGGTAGPVQKTITVPAGATVPSNPPYNPAELSIAQGNNTVLVVNEDSAPHTVTSGTGPADPDSGESFNSGFINPGDQKEMSIASLGPGEYPYYCVIHPYMKGKLTVVAAAG